MSMSANYISLANDVIVVIVSVGLSSLAARRLNKRRGKSRTKEMGKESYKRVIRDMINKEDKDEQTAEGFDSFIKKNKHLFDSEYKKIPPQSFDAFWEPQTRWGMEDKELCEHTYSVNRPWFVSKVSLSDREKRVDIFLSHEDGVRWLCPLCENLFAVSDHIRERVRVILEWSEKSSRFTQRFKSHAIDILQSTDMTKASRIRGISLDQSQNIMDRGEAMIGKKNFNAHEDGHRREIAQKDRHYVTLVHDLENPCVDYVEFEWKHGSIDRYYDHIGNGKAVSIDMWDPYISSTREHVDDADSKIVFDKFHISKHMNPALDTVGKIKSRTADSKEILKKTRYMWLCSSGNLPDRYREKYEILKESDLETAGSYAIKGNLRNLWSRLSQEDEKQFWKHWYFWATHYKLKPVIEKMGIIKNHLYGAMAYFIHRIINAILEGKNSKISAIQKVACGYRNKDYFKTAIYFHCGNLQLYLGSNGSKVLPT